MISSNLIFWEMNEVNFDFIKFYADKGLLPHWKMAIEKYGIGESYSEAKYENIEPWIQWPSIRTGKTLEDHGIYRLGDVESKKLMQHWEIIEAAGYTVAALSPINAVNNTKKSDFWVPDPWVTTVTSGDSFTRLLYKAIKQAVNDNSRSHVTYTSKLILLFALVMKSLRGSYLRYLIAGLGILRDQKWSKAILLDRLLADIFIRNYKEKSINFSVLFTNAAAHIQHHYMCNSSAYFGKVKNPEWYVSSTKDPLLEVYQLYDEILSNLISLPNARLIVATGIRQIPHEVPLFYWRLKDHALFLRKLGINYKSVLPRMTRDFHVIFDSESDMSHCIMTLSKIKDSNNVKMFDLIQPEDSRRLFLSLTYPYDISGANFSSFPGDIKDFIVFVAIKNGMHDTKGYILDTNSSAKHIAKAVPVHFLFKEIISHFNINEI